MKKILKTFSACMVALLAICSNSHAQNQKLRFEHIGIEEGLESTDITTILQDKKGYIWLGTFKGLYKYDGYSFTKYQFNPYDSNSLSQNLIYTIFEDQQGSIWVSTLEGLCKFDRNTEKFTRYKPDATAKFSDPNIGSINEDSEGMIWVGSLSGGLCRFDRQTGKFLPEYFDLGFQRLAGNQPDLHDNVNIIYKDRRGTLWAGNESGLHEIKLIPSTNNQPSVVKITDYLNDPANEHSLINNVVTAIFEDHSGILWIGTADGLNSFDRRTRQFTRYQNASTIGNYFNKFSTGIDEDREGNLWIATDRGLIKLNKERKAFTTYLSNSNDPFSISSNTVSTLYIDRAGILWVGSVNAKLNKANLNQKPFGLVIHDPANANSLSSNNVTSILEDSSGIVWIGTYDQGLNRWDKKANRFTHYKHNPANIKTLRSDMVFSIFEDRHGHIWVCNGEYLSLLNKQTGEFTHYNSNAANYEDLDHRVILAATQDKEGLIWLGTGNGIKSFNESNSKFIHYYHNPADSTGISDYTAGAIFADSKDNIWVGFGSIATDRLDKRTGHIKHYKHNQADTASISSNIVSSFYEDSKGNIWLGTWSGGLCRYDYTTDKFTTFTIEHGLPDNSVYSILGDNKSHLWLGTGNGLSEFDPAKNTFTNYDFKDGLQSGFFAAGHRSRPSRFKGRDGILYFGGPGGFNFFDPLQLKLINNPSPVVITQFKLFDKLVKGANESAEIALKYSENYFSFEFSSLSFYNPAKNQYAYKLEGVDPDWVYSGSRRYAAYTNISPGDYTFKVKATNSDGVWNKEGVSISIVIKPPWWLTWWAYAIYGVLLIALGLAIHRFQKQRVVRAEREKAQKKELEQAKEIEKAYHELKTTQQQLIQSEKMASLGELTAGIAHEIQNPLNFVNNFSEVNAELIQELVSEVDKGNTSEIKALANDIKENQEKINQHGKRADAIVKGMLQHSRSSSGVKEPTDINKLADEYLRLSYHGLRAKDKSFNTTLKTDFGESIGNINIIPQDIGRVLLNLFTNAFYAVNEKNTLSTSAGQQYEPTVSISTKKINDKIEIRVKDNGNGIPQKVLDKIFQPFFTTKPAGQGTGLGLSLSYDIVKAHGGELKAETKEGEGSEFIVQLPVI
jgi:ligand-binding sensor domain-containing protein/signal transduction histidine kinase